MTEEIKRRDGSSAVRWKSCIHRFHINGDCFLLSSSLYFEHFAFFFYKILLPRQVFLDSILTTIRKLAKICLLQVTNLFSNQNIDVRKEMTFETKCEG